MTHDVTNQVPQLEDFNMYKIDRPLQEYLRMGSEVPKDVVEYGRLMGSSAYIEKGFQANQFKPEFHTHDSRGRRIDEVRFHPAYHDIMKTAIAHGLHSSPWIDQRSNPHLIRLAKYYMHAQNEAGSGCPVTMTFSSVPAIKNYLPQSDTWLPKILRNTYDPDNKPYFEKEGLTIGMAMTEKQGGTDVRANTTLAKPIAGRESGTLFTLTGHKWFCSAPMCDAFLTLAQTEVGLSCFLMPRWKPDGMKNDFRIQRLKDKLGNRSNASSEIELDGAVAWLMGVEGRGVATILNMVGMTRYDCMIGSSALMRRAVTEVVHHISHRHVMGKLLIDQPVMQQVVADLCIESEAALAMTLRAAQCLEHSGDDKEQLLLRLLMPIGKYWITKRANMLLAEAMECIGGNGYVEESILPRLYREAPVNAIWEGSGNVQCLDVLRAVNKNEAIIEVYVDELKSALGRNGDYDTFVSRLISKLPALLGEESQARRLTSSLAIGMQACQLLKLENTMMADAFCASRLKDESRGMFGDVNSGLDTRGVLNRYVFEY